MLSSRNKALFHVCLLAPYETEQTTGLVGLFAVLIGLVFVMLDSFLEFSDLLFNNIHLCILLSKNYGRRTSFHPWMKAHRLFSLVSFRTYLKYIPVAIIHPVDINKTHASRTHILSLNISLLFESAYHIFCM